MTIEEMVEYLDRELPHDERQAAVDMIMRSAVVGFCFTFDLAPVFGARLDFDGHTLALSHTVQTLRQFAFHHTVKL